MVTVYANPDKGFSLQHHSRSGTCSNLFKLHMEPSFTLKSPRRTTTPMRVGIQGQCDVIAHRVSLNKNTNHLTPKSQHRLSTPDIGGDETKELTAPLTSRTVRWITQHPCVAKLNENKRVHDSDPAIIPK